MSEIRVRFAPSPTGFLHVGGARTAIFNWLFAKNTGGKFLLRIEDTDPERSRSELSEQIIRSMKWLGLEHDEAIVYQALNIKRHKEAVLELLNSGKAYYAFETPEELDILRKQSSASKAQYKYNRASLGLDKETVQKYLQEGKPYAIRFKVPEGITEFDDLVHSKTAFNNSEIEDFILIRSDGTPVYQIAVVVDDHDMKISHVIRGDDHLSNTPKQILLYKAFGWEIPVFAHLPMILDEQKKKLSKRKNTVSADEYKDKGYLPEALFNFLTLLGFAPPLMSSDTIIPAAQGDIRSGKGNDEPAAKDFANIKREMLSREEFIKVFSFVRVNKKSAVFDMKKLNWINSEYIKMADENRIAEMVLAELKSAGKGSDVSLQYVLKVTGLMKERVSAINDFAEYGDYFFTDPVKYDEKGLSKFRNSDAEKIITGYKTELEKITEWSSVKLEENLRNYAELHGIKASEIIHPARLILTGKTVSPGIFELMEVLGKETVIRRINNFPGK